ncbi:hypothetical protein D3C71_1169370 [compost metagenome]
MQTSLFDSLNDLEQQSIQPGQCQPRSLQKMGQQLFSGYMIFQGYIHIDLFDKQTQMVRDIKRSEHPALDGMNAGCRNLLLNSKHHSHPFMPGEIPR